jgi:predicted SAM-dependent methyltransferase
MKILEIGPGDKPIEGAETLNVSEIPADFHATLGSEKLPIEDEQYDLVYMSHVLEHVPWFQTNFALNEIYRILKVGGSVEVWVPDFGYLSYCYIEGQFGDNWVRLNNREHPTKWVASRIFSYGPGANWHKAIFDRDYLKFCLEGAGFMGVENLTTPRGYDHGKINMGMVGYKR